MKQNRLDRMWVARASAAALLFCTGCGVLSAGNTEFSHHARGTEGQKLYVEDIDAIVNDAELDDAGKRQALRDLGILDEDLIGVLLTIQPG